jgi:iron complex outermembrane receptor protein
MTFRATSSALALCAALGVGAVAPAFAQATNAASAASPAGTDAADIVVTARRIEERLQDVPISITVYNQQQLANRNIVNAQDLASYTPSLSANSTFGSQNTTFAIRGFVQEQNTTPSVGTYFADVVAPRAGGPIPVGDGAGPGSFFDLQNVQVLKGPQGTLQGRNTTGGAVLLVPQKPTSRTEGYIEGSYGNYGMKRIQAVFNTPLGDKARFRIGVDHEDRDGYAKNDSGIGPKAFDDINYTAVRASLVVDLTPDLENYTIASYSRSDTNGSVFGLFTCNPENSLGFFSCGQLAAKKKGFYQVESDITDPYSRMSQWQVINTTTWHASDTLTVKNIASYAQFKDSLRSDNFGTDWTLPLPAAFGGPQPITFTTVNPTPGLAQGDQSTFTEELQFQGRALNDRLTWQAGGYLEISDPLGRVGASGPTLLTCSNAAALQCTDYFGLLTGAATGSVSVQSGTIRFDDKALYGQASYALTDQLKLTGGIRYTWDTVSADEAIATYQFPAPNTPVGYCVSADARNPSLPITALSDCELHYHNKSSAPTWLIDLDYKPIDNVLLYAKYARGYRQGSVNPYAAEGYTSFGPEKVDSYEIGLKSSFRGAVRGTFNVSGFYNNFTNQQIQVGFTSSTGNVTPTQGIVNAGKSRIWGAEVEASLTPFTGFTLDGSYTYLNTKLTSLSAPPLVAGSRFDTIEFTSAPGDPLPLSPKHKATITGTYRLPVSPALGRIDVGATFTYTARQLVTSASPFGYLKPTKLLNLNLNWNGVAGSNFDVSLFATNVTAEKYYLTVAGFYNNLGFESGQLGEPRMFGGRLRYHF